MINTELNKEKGIDGINKINLSKIKKSLDKKAFDGFLDSFGENKSESINKIEILMSKNKIKLSNIDTLGLNINNILNYDERDNINKKIQESVCEVYLSKLHNKGRLNLPFNTIFDSCFKNAKKNQFKGFVFGDIKVKINELAQKFPDWVNNIEISNGDIIENLNENGCSINKINTFGEQDISDRKILSELLFLETKNITNSNQEKLDELNKNIEGLVNLPLSPISVIEDDIWEINNNDKNNKIQNLLIDKASNRDKIGDDIIEDKKKLLISKIDKINLKLRKSYLEELSENKENSEYVNILDKLVNNNFDFNKLEISDQKNLTDKIVELQISKLNKNNIIDTLKINKKDLENFVRQIYDFGKPEEIINFEDKDGNDIKIHIKKSFEPGEHKNLLDFNSFKNLESLPINFEIDLDKSNFDIQQFPELFGSGLNRGGTTSKYKAKNGDVYVSNHDTLEIEGIKLSYDEFYELLTCEKDELSDMLKKYKLSDKVKGKKGDFEELLKWMNVEVLANKIKLSGLDTNKLIQSYILANSLNENEKKIESKDQETTTKLLNQIDEEGFRGESEGVSLAEGLFGEIDNYMYEPTLEAEIQGDVESGYNNLDDVGKQAFEDKALELADKHEDPNAVKVINNLINDLKSGSNLKGKPDQNGIKEKQETPEQRFMKFWESLPGNDFDGDKEKGFRVGTRLMINIGGSKLPPKDKDDSFFEFEIVDIKEDTFKIKAIGGEIKDSAEGQIFSLPKTEEKLSSIQHNGAIYKVDKLKSKDWRSSLKNIIASKIFDKMTVFGSGEGQVKMENGKFINHEGNEIVGFGREIDDFIGGKGQTKIYTTYNIKSINKSRGTVNLQCNFKDQDPDNLSENIDYKYNNELTFEQFILLMESKKVRGYTKEEHTKREAIGKIDTKERDAKKGKLNFYSLSSIVGAVKSGFKKIGDAWNKYDEEQTEDFENLLYSEEGLNLYSKFGKAFGVFGVFDGVTDAFETSKMEFYADRENRTWKKTEKRYKLYESDPHFATLRKEHFRKLLDTPGFIGKHKDRHKMAAAFLFLMKKDGPYGRGGFLKHYGTGFYVEKFLGGKHKALFEQYRDEKKRQLEEYKDINHVHWRKNIQAELNRLEFDYLVGVIDGRQPFGGKGDDEDFQASVWSRNFATTLDENADKHFNDFKKRSEDVGQISFRQAEQEYFRMVTAGRFHKALPFLKRMIEDAQNKGQEDRAKMNFLGAMLTGLFKNAGDAEVMTEFWAIARTIGLLPGIWCRDTDQADKLQILLDGITANPPFEQFSKNTGFKRSDFEFGTFDGGGGGKEGQTKMKFLSEDFPKYWTKYGDKILDVLEFKDMEAKNSIINLAEEGGENSKVFQDIIEFSREKTKEDINQNVSYTYGYYVRSPWTANKGMIDGLVPKNGEFQGKETIERESAEAFWKSAATSIKTESISNKGSVEFYLGKFYNWFNTSVWDQSNTKIFMRGLSLVKKLKNEGNHEEAKYNLWYMVKGLLHDSIGSFPSEFGMVVDKFNDFFWNNVDMIDKGMVGNTFGNEAAVEFDDKYGMLPWGEFSSNYMIFGNMGGGKPKTDYQKKHKLYEEHYINWEVDRLNKSLKRKGISGMPFPPEKSEVKVVHPVGYESDLAA